MSKRIVNRIHILLIIAFACAALVLLISPFFDTRAFSSAPQGKGGQVVAKPTPKKTATPKRTSSRSNNNRSGKGNAAVNTQHETITNKIGMEFVWVPPGSFMMGSETGNAAEKPAHRVTFVVDEQTSAMARFDLPKTETEFQTSRRDLKRARELREASVLSNRDLEAAQERYQLAKIKLDSMRTTTGEYGFFMGRCEVTQSQWQNVMGNNPSNHKNCGDCPVENVSWYDAQEFLDKLNDANDGYRYRLPNEAEWEYACRAGKSNDLVKIDTLAWYGKNSTGKTHPVGQLLPNAFGIYDMLGNVREWCLDWYHENYDGAPTDGNVWSSGGIKTQTMLRGGSYSDGAYRLRASARGIADPPYSAEFLGFRVVAFPQSR